MLTLTHCAERKSEATDRWNRIQISAVNVKNGSSFWFLFLDCDRQSIQVVVPSHTHYALHNTERCSIRIYFIFFLLLTHFWLDDKWRNLNMNLQKICWHIIHIFFVGTLSSSLTVPPHSHQIHHRKNMIFWNWWARILILTHLSFLFCMNNAIKSVRFNRGDMSPRLLRFPSSCG